MPVIRAMQRTLFSVALVCCWAAVTIVCQNEIFEQDVRKAFQDELAQIPGLDNLNASAVPQLAEMEDALKRKCEANGGSGAFEKLGPAKEEAQRCIESNFNVTHMEAELDDARKRGAMEEVFGKYCKRRNVVLTCLQNLIDVATPCLQDEEKKTLAVVRNVTDNVVEFFCFKDGDRVAMFIAEGGLECLKSQKDRIEGCLNSTLNSKIPANFSPADLPTFAIDNESCKDYNNLHSCMVQVLERCQDPTPANVVDALFKFVRNITPCATKGPRPLKSNKGQGGNAISVVSNSILITVSLMIAVTNFR